MIHIPLAVYLLFAAPLAALAVGFFVTRPYKPEWTHIPILFSCVVVTLSAAYLAAFVYTGRGLDGTLFRWMVAGDWTCPSGCASTASASRSWPWCPWWAPSSMSTRRAT